MRGIGKRLDKFLVANSLVPLSTRYHSWVHLSTISNHFPACLEWDDTSHTRNYNFKFNRAWIQVEYFSQLVISSWPSKNIMIDCDDMTMLVMKLKRLKAVVKDWEIMDDLDLGWVHMHPMLIHDVSKVLNPLHVKRTFLQIGI